MSFMPGTGNGRGGYAPRRGRGGWSRPFFKRPEPVKPDIARNPLGDLLVSLRVSDLTPSSRELYKPTGIDDSQYVASYNWLAGRDSRILVPGQPPQWTPLRISQKLLEDSGNFYRDPNAACYPDYPIAPAVKAILNTTRDAPIDPDVFGCGNTFGNLLRFARGIDKAFRFNVEVIGDTVFFIRKENDPKELIEGIRGFGHSFPDAYTTWPKDVKGSTNHQRIVQYSLGDMKCLIRFECDGFLDDSFKADCPQSSTAPPPSADSLTEALSESAIFAPPTTSTSTSTSTRSLSTERAGEVVSQTSIFDLKTRSGKRGKDVNMDDITPQLWLKQIPNFIIAYHDGFGLFEDKDIQIQDARALISDFEKNNADAICRYAVLLNKIIVTAKSDDTSLLEVYSPGKDLLEIRRQYGNGVYALPEALKEEWVASCDKGGLRLNGEDTGHGAMAISSSPCTDGKEFDDVFVDSDDEKDFTACSAAECGYCGRCTY